MTAWGNIIGGLDLEHQELRSQESHQGLRHLTGVLVMTTTMTVMTVMMMTTTTTIEMRKFKYLIFLAET